MKKITPTAFMMQYLKKNFSVAFIAFISLILPCLTLSEYIHEAEYFSKSEKAQAEVRSKSIGKDRNGSKQYRIQYSFKIPGSILGNSGTAGRAKWEKLSKGDKIEIRYIKDNPADSRIWQMGLFIDPLSYDFKDIFFPFIASPLFLIESIWLLSILRKDKRLIQDIFTKGIKTEGKIIKATFADIKNDPHYEIKYDFRIASGRTYCGIFAVPALKEGDPHPEVGETGYAYYLESDPEKNAWGWNDWTKALPIMTRKSLEAKK